MTEPTTTQPDDHIDREDAMLLLRVKSRRTLRRYEQLGWLTPIPRGPATNAPVLYLRSEVAKILEKQAEAQSG